MDWSSCSKSPGGCPIKVSAPMERAKPKIRSDKDSIRDLGVERYFSSAIIMLSLFLQTGLLIIEYKFKHCYFMPIFLSFTLFLRGKV
jgi:hypothetical protein